MKAVICRVQSASVSVDGQVAGRIDRGLLVYVGVIEGDGSGEVMWMAQKLAAIRLFPDDQGKMNRSVSDVGGGLLLIPNFTLAARARKGTRPSFTDAADPELAESLFEQLACQCSDHVPTRTGVFGGDMRIESVCDGPVTIVVETPDR